MKYKLINQETKEEHLCDKVTIDGFDYYVSTEIRVNRNDFYYDFHGNIHQWTHDFQTKNKLPNSIADTHPKVMATNNQTIDIPKVLDEVEIFAKEQNYDLYNSHDTWAYFGFKNGYKKSQETHSFSEEDMIEFTEWYINVFLDDVIGLNGKEKMDKYKHLKNQGVTKELLQLWKEQQQQPKIVYYG